MKNTSTSVDRGECGKVQEIYIYPVFYIGLYMPLDLDFGQCLTLLIIGFIFALIAVRCLLAVVNRGYSVIDYAKEQLYGKSGGQKTGLKDVIVETVVKPVMQGLAPKIIEGLTGKKP